jgi:serine protease
VTGITLAREVADPQAALELLRQHPAAEAAEPLQVYTASFTPNDPDRDRQWNMKLVDMPKGWERTGGKGVVVEL